MRYWDILGCKTSPKIVRRALNTLFVILVNVFTDQEKEKVNQEFAYYNMKGDNN